MNLMTRILLLCLLSLCAACSTASASSLTPASVTTSLPPMATLRALTPTALPTEDALAAFPRCSGMQILPDPVQFDWPNLKNHIDDFTGSKWIYYSCEQPQAIVATLYREQMPGPPFNLWEVNWFDRKEGTLGVYFSQKGMWDYVWIVPQLNDDHKTYIIIAESFAYVEC